MHCKTTISVLMYCEIESTSTYNFLRNKKNTFFGYDVIIMVGV